MCPISWNESCRRYWFDQFGDTLEVPIGSGMLIQLSAEDRLGGISIGRIDICFAIFVSNASSLCCPNGLALRSPPAQVKGLPPEAGGTERIEQPRVLQGKYEYSLPDPRM